jgi:transcription elongation GreA/GreB family factor
MVISQLKHQLLKALVGKFVDDEVEIVTPSGKMTYEIIEVKHI